MVSSYPDNFFKIDELVLRINSDFTNDTDKARAIFYWISKTISYDVEFAKKIESQNLKAFSYKTEKELIEKEKKFNSNLALLTFNEKSSTCHGYSALYCEIANKLGLECKLIRGNLKSDPTQIGINLETNHGWNVVKINGQWKFIDCTLAAGNISSKTDQFVFNFNDIYFFTEPKLFFLNHFPDDEKWLLVDNKSKTEYINLPVCFPDFIKNESKLIFPNKGVFSDKEIFDIKFNEFDFENDNLEYKFSSDSQKVYVKLNSKPTSYAISLENKGNQSLLIFINRRLLVIYKIIAK
ncbi:transglutaminase domain-containing protein [Flavobacterium sp.]|uniref:transglutaminase domain-containing protein n=1 Tax=Flavobacterium sp. TaxID=239 RepID=UPI0038FCBCB4